MGGGSAKPASPVPQAVFPGVYRRGQVVKQKNSCYRIGTNPPINPCYDSGEWAAEAPDSIIGNGCCYEPSGPTAGQEYVGGSCPGNTGGGPVNCRLVSYNANRFQCAVSGVNPQTGLRGRLNTCDPEWLPGGTQNAPLVQEYCRYFIHYPVSRVLTTLQHRAVHSGPSMPPRMCPGGR
jgi:hypothetical protein